MQRKECLPFVHLTAELVVLIKDLFETSQYLESFCDGLITSREISEFMHVTKIVQKIDNPDEKEIKKREYKRSMDKLELDVKLLYKFGATSFLSAKNIVGDSETFYFHMVRYYIPVISRDTCSKFQLGLGIFSMQGVEHRNKYSKCTLRNHSNNKGNIVINNLDRLWDVFDHGFQFVNE